MSDDGGAGATSATASPATSTTTTKVGSIGQGANSLDHAAQHEYQTAARLKSSAQGMMNNHPNAETVAAANGMLAEAAKAEETGQMAQGAAAAFRNWMAGLVARARAS